MEYLSMAKVMLIMMNMLLAIIMDVYSEVKSNLGSAETLVSQDMAELEAWDEENGAPGSGSAQRADET